MSENEYFVSCENSEGEPEIIRVTIDAEDDDPDGDAVLEMLAEAGYGITRALIFSHPHYFNRAECHTLS